MTRVHFVTLSCVLGLMSVGAAGTGRDSSEDSSEHKICGGWTCLTVRSIVNIKLAVSIQQRAEGMRLSGTQTPQRPEAMLWRLWSQSTEF